jgi:nucleolar MIF4G domain-containing protein 1
LFCVAADQRGKWWLVGSAWTGNEQKQDRNMAKPTSTTSEFSQKLLELARKQRMNTDDRRSVFCIIMSAEDYMDAFEKIVQLSIKDQRTIVTVIIHCCLSEKVFNPYYAVLSQKFCDHDRKYVLAVQYALWDRLRDLHSLSKVQVNNLAQYLIYLIGHGGQPLSVLKVIEFGELDKVTLRLVRQIMLSLLLGQEAICEQVFERIAPSFKLNTFKDSVRLFLHHFLLKDTKQGSISDEQMKLLKKRVQIADKSLATSDSRIQF